MKHMGNLNIMTAADALRYADVTEVGGHVVIGSEGASLPLLAEVGGHVDIRAKGAILPLIAVEHAFSTWSLRRNIKTGLWSAGCRGPWTTAEALAHWGGRDDERARLFCAAIKEATK